MRDIRILCFAIAAQIEPEVLSAVLTKLSFMTHYDDGDIVLHVSSRQPSGWLEWRADFYEGDQYDCDHEPNPVMFVLGIIQRAFGAEVEYHS